MKNVATHGAKIVLGLIGIPAAFVVVVAVFLRDGAPPLMPEDAFYLRADPAADRLWLVRLPDGTFGHLRAHPDAMPAVGSPVCVIRHRGTLAGDLTLQFVTDGMCPVQDGRA